jgi:hypothetical protein
MPQDRLSRWYTGVQRWSDADVASAAKTTTGTGAAFNTDNAFAVLASLNITAVSGTSPTLDVRLETTADGGATWYTVASFPQQTAATGTPVARVFAPVGAQARFAWTIGGTTPSFTFAVTSSGDIKK